MIPPPCDPPDDPPRRAEVRRHAPFDVRAQHLHGDDLAIVAGAVHLAERGRGHRLPLERLEHLVDASPVALPDRACHGVERHRRHLVDQRAQLREVRVGDQVGTRREDLRKLDEGGSEVRDGSHEFLRAKRMVLRGSLDRRAPPQPSAIVPQERDGERTEGEDDAEGVHTDKLPRTDGPRRAAKKWRSRRTATRTMRNEPKSNYPQVCHFGILHEGCLAARFSPLFSPPRSSPPPSSLLAPFW